MRFTAPLCFFYYLIIYTEYFIYQKKIFTIIIIISINFFKLLNKILKQTMFNNRLSLPATSKNLSVYDYVYTQTYTDIGRYLPQRLWQISVITLAAFIFHLQHGQPCRSCSKNSKAFDNKQAAQIHCSQCQHHQVLRSFHRSLSLFSILAYLYQTRKCAGLPSSFLSAESQLHLVILNPERHHLSTLSHSGI